MTDKPIWIPCRQRQQNARFTDFVARIRQNRPDVPADYQGFHAWTVRHSEIFWSELWEYFAVLGNPGSVVLANSDAMPGAKWFPEGTLNFAENLLRWSEQPDFAHQPAIIQHSESGQRMEISWQELSQKANGLAAFFRQQGIGKGDRVAAFMPNSMDSVIGMLAAASLGAIWSSCSPDFGLQGVIDRFGQIRPKILIACNGYHYNGKIIDTRNRVEDICRHIPSLETLVWSAYVATLDCPKSTAEAIQYFNFDAAVREAATLDFQTCEFSDPLYIMYSSGTTGVPKCIVHGIGGTLLQHLKELALHTDLRAGDRIFYFTTCGWMMWNWLVSSLALGATLVLYDGSPFYPRVGRLFDLIDQEHIRIFGAGAKFYSACDKAGLEPLESHDLASLDTLLSTGSPLAHETFDYLYQKVKSEVCVSSISGGTDIISCFALGHPCLPVYRGELQCIGLAMDVAFYDAAGQPVQGEKGELVCQRPFPSMPLGFWNDPEDSKFHAAYFAQYANTWAHGDYGEIVRHEADRKVPAQDGVIIHGRADAVLNPGGVRIGTAEIYRQVEKVDAVLEAIAIGQQWQNDERIVLFVKLKPGFQLDNSLKEAIVNLIRSNTTPRHVPAKILQVADIPRTISGKIVELAVKNIIHNKPVKNKDALANPEALDLFRNIEELDH